MAENINTPSATDAKDFIEKHHVSKPDKTVLMIIGDCMIDYKGRARSFLDWGERIIMIKQDGAVLVHQPTMREPVNWQPSGSKTEFKIKDDKLILKSRHLKPPEKMNVTFRNIQTINASSLKDKAKLVISGMELDVVNQILAKLDLDMAEVVTIYYGSDADSAEADKISASITERHPQLQIEVIRGGQPHYNYIISVE